MPNMLVEQNCPDEYLQDICRNFPQFSVSSWSTLGEGQMSRAILVNGEYVFRFPKHDEAAETLNNEILLLPRIATYLTLCIPRFEFIGRQANGWPFVGYAIIPGDLLSEDVFGELPKQIQQRVAEQIAQFMNEMQAIPVQHIPELTPVDFRTIYARDRDGFHDCLVALSADVRKYVKRRFEEFLNNDSYFNHAPRLIHADLSPDHYVLNRDLGELAGIIDFGDLQISDPDYEYTYILEDIGPEFTRRILELRGEQQIDAKLEKIRYFVTFDHVRSILRGIFYKQETWIKEGIEALNKEETEQCL